MSRSPAQIAKILLPLSFLAGCYGEGDPTEFVPAPTVVNLGLVAQASELAADGDLLLVGAREFQAGGRDLNGDGDAFDLVAFVVDLATGTTHDTGLALENSAPTRLAAVRGDLAAFAISEQQNGGRDRNGDGDANDALLVVHDGRDGSRRELGLALSLLPGLEPGLGDDIVAFTASEAGQRADLDGDGLLDGNILHLYDRITGTLTNTGLDTPSRLFVEGEGVAFFEAENGTDKNGDGDGDDAFVLQIYDIALGMQIDSGLATDGAPPIFAGGFWMVNVLESDLGVDLDGDRRLESDILHTFDPKTGMALSLGIACVDFPCAIASPEGLRPRFAFRRNELAGDLNGDGDQLDLVPHLYNPATDGLFSTGVASVSPPLFGGGALGFLASELEQNEDLDGDGEIGETVAFRANLLTGRATSLEQQAIDLRGSDDFLLLARLESTAAMDWNGDGDQLDVVVHVYDPATDETINTRVASVDVFDASAQSVLLYVDELAQGEDLNFDRDLLDQVFVPFDLMERRALSLGLAGGFGGNRFGRLGTSGRMAFLANEEAQSQDLNGDGDLGDDVLFRGF